LLDIRGIIVNDVWINDNAIRLTAEHGQTKISTIFTLHTVVHSDIVVQLENPSNWFSIREKGRKKEGEETIITLQLEILIDDKEFVSDVLKVVSSDGKIPLINIPFYRYREKTDSRAELSTVQINLGVIKPGEKKFFKIYGDCDIIAVIRNVSFKDVPVGISVALVEAEEKYHDFLNIAIQADVKLLPCVFEGNVCLTSQGHREYSIPINGEIR
jgi:hypothetical protein